jgi:predicted dinucleotide-binding enzyme
LIHDVGFEPIDAGPLRMARCLEPFALLVARLAYEGDGGPELAYRIERFGVSVNRRESRRARTAIP